MISLICGNISSHMLLFMLKGFAQEMADIPCVSYINAKSNSNETDAIYH